MDEKIEKYILDIIFATRYPEKYKLGDLKALISFGASPRGSINLATAAKCYAFIKRRGYVIPEDVRAICKDVLRHRLGLSYEAEAENITSEDIITEILCIFLYIENCFHVDIYFLKFATFMQTKCKLG